MQQHAESTAQFTRPAPLTESLLIQLTAAVAAYAMLGVANVGGFGALWPWLAGALAAAASAVLRLPRWWIAIHLALPAAACALLASAIPAWVYLAAFLALWLANTSAWRARVPLYLSSRAAALAILDELPAQWNFAMLDAGCGIGSMLMPVARARRNGCFAGVELAPLPFLLSWVRSHAMSGGPRIRWGSLWQEDFAAYDVVYVFLSPAAMPRLWRKAVNEMRPGTLLISNSFAVPGVAPLRVIPYAARRELYIWQM